MKAKLAALGIVILALGAAVTMAGVEDRWLHIRVDEHDADGESVRVNVPLSMVAALLPTIQTDELDHGVLILDKDDLDLDEIDLARALEALRDAPDADFITVQGRDENVRVAKERGFVIIEAHERDADKVRVRMPLAVVDAMLEGRSNGRLDLVAALNALAEHDNEDLVTVESPDSSVRIWIDSDESGD